jgi:hypothetical protein
MLTGKLDAMLKIPSFFIVLCVFLPMIVLAEESPVTLSYPEGKLNGLQIAEQVYAVSHGQLVKNALSKKNGKDIAMVVNRAPLEKRKAGRRPIVNTFETYGNSHPENPDLESMQMAIVMSGKARGTGILFVSYADKTRPAIMSLWLPALRKIRRINEPQHEDTWVGTNLTYGELVLRRPEHEIHELLKEDVFPDCLKAMELAAAEINRYTKKLPSSQCDHKGKAVYVVKSTTRFEHWWYDYHISEIDKRTFGIYRTVYFKDGKKIKTIYIDWRSLEQEDPRIIYPRYIYAITHENGMDSMVYVPRKTILLNQDLPDDFWSEKTLKKYGKR